jgi:hypothetical protein
MAGCIEEGAGDSMRETDISPANRMRLYQARKIPLDDFD